MFFGTSHIHIQVSDLDKAISLWCDVIGLAEHKRGSNFVDVDSGSVILRLIERDVITHPVIVRIHAADIQAAFNRLLDAGMTSYLEPAQTDDLELVAGARDTDGNTILVWRELTEDEYNFTPDLPTESEWQPEAEALLKQLLKRVPAMFRATARKRTTRAIEALSREEGNDIDREQVIRGYIMATPRFMRSQLVEPLREEGINTDNYRAEFDSD